jgi:hypothetical protein
MPGLPPSQQEYQLGGRAYEIRNDEGKHAWIATEYLAMTKP